MPSPELFLPSLSLGLLIGAFLWINEFPDYEADKAAGKRTLVVRLGRRRASHVFGMVIGLAFVTHVLAVLLVGPALALGFAALVPGVSAARRLWKDPENMKAIIPAQVLTLLSFVVFALLAGLGFLLR